MAKDDRSPINPFTGKEHYDAVADLHDVLRSKYLRTCFALSGVRVAVVKKGRKEKKELIGHGQTHQALQPMTDRYASVVRQVGLQIDLSGSMQLDLRDESFSSICKLAGSKGDGERWVGVAPFANHRFRFSISFADTFDNASSVI